MIRGPSDPLGPNFQLPSRSRLRPLQVLELMGHLFAGQANPTGEQYAVQKVGSTCGRGGGCVGCCVVVVVAVVVGNAWLWVWETRGV